jgi:plastocyanin
MLGRMRIALALALSLLAFTAGCGGDDEPSAGGDTTTEQSTTTDTQTETEFTTTADDNGTQGVLEGETGPGFEIKLRQDGEDVQTLTAGTYTISVEDQSSMHNFHLTGPGVDEEITEVGFEGERTVTVQLEPGEYTFQCDPHASSMRGTFTVS